jgi:hypothetical protein
VKLLQGGTITVKIEKSNLAKATLDLAGELDVTIPNTNGLKLGGTLKGKYENSLIDLDAKLTLRSMFQYTNPKVVARMNTGDMTVKVEGSKFKWATLNLSGEVDVTVPNSDGLKLGGTLKGKYDATDGLDLDCGLKVRETFTYTKGAFVARLLQNGTITVKVEKNDFKKATLDLAGELDATIANTNGLKLGGTLKGKYENDLIDIDAKLSLRSQFVYTNPKVVARLNTGDMTVKVEKSEFKWATLNLAGEVDVNIPNTNGLKLGGTLKGKYDATDGLDLDCGLKVRETFVYTKSNFVARLLQNGTITVKVEKNEFKKATLDLAGELDVTIPNSNGLKLGGTIKGKYENDLIDVDAKLTLREQFVYTKDKLTARLNTGELTVKVEKSKFKKATINVEGEADITIPNTNGLKLAGSLKGKYENSAFDLDCKLRLREQFDYAKAPVTARFLSGELGLKVKANNFQEATFKGIKAELDVDIKGQTLALEGSIDNGKYKDDLVEFDADLKLKSPFTYTKSPLTARLLSGELGAKVKASKLVEATFNNIKAEVDVDIKGQTLSLEGTLDKGSYKPGVGVSFDASLKLKSMFTYTQGKVTARLLSGKLGAKVTNSKLDYATFDDIKVEVDIDIKGQTLAVEGSVTDGKYENDKIRFNAGLKLKSMFTYTKGKVTARLLSGQLGVKVSNSKLDEATFDNIKAEVDVDIKGQILALEGSITNGKYKDDKIGFDVGLKLKSMFTYTKGKVTARFLSGELGVKVENSKFIHATFDNIKVEVDIDIKGQTLAIEGSITDGKYKDGKIDFNADLKLRQPFTYEKGKVKAVLQSGELGVKVKNSKLVEATFNNIVVDVEVDIKGQLLKLNGSITEGRYKDGKIDFKASLKLTAPFTYERGKVKAVLVSGKVGAEIKNSKLVQFTFDDIVVTVDVDIKGQLLKLEGSITEGRYKNEKIDFKASLKLVSPFTYKQGKVTAVLVSGKVGVEKIGRASCRERV